jgi:hypothetical protein
MVAVSSITLLNELDLDTSHPHQTGGYCAPVLPNKIGTKWELMLKTGEQTSFVTYTGPQGSFIPSFELTWPVPWTLDKKDVFSHLVLGTLVRDSSVP